MTKKNKGGGLALFDPRFAAFHVPDIAEKMESLTAAAMTHEEEVADLRQRVASITVLEVLKKAVSFKCSRTFQPITIIACKYQRRRSNCHCDALKSWIQRYVLDD